MQALRTSRLRAELEDVQQAAQFNDLDQSIIYLGPKISNGQEDLDVWTLKFRGKPNSNLFPGIYEVEMKMPPNFPASFPQCKFLYDFKHYHVFATGTICHPLLKTNGWSSNKSLIELGTSIIHMVHSPPVVGDQANNRMAQLYNKNPNDYFQMLRDQAKRFEKYK